MKIYLIIILSFLTSYFIFTLDTSNDFINKYQKEFNNLNLLLIEKGVDNDWFKKSINSDFFKIHNNIEKYFNSMNEAKTKNSDLDFEAYKKILWFDKKIELGLIFIENHKELLAQIESKNGIRKELIAAIIGIETNYAEIRQKGNFYVFNTLVSQYIFLENRRKFAVNELYYLYKFSKRISKKTEYFIGSFAGASGWAQFLPSSFESYFIDTNLNEKDIDIYGIDDSLSSIDNYLHGNGLNLSNIDDEKSLYNAIYSYNHSDFYVRGVIYIYDNLRKTKK